MKQKNMSISLFVRMARALSIILLPVVSYATEAETITTHSDTDSASITSASISAGNSASRRTSTWGPTKESRYRNNEKNFAKQAFQEGRYEYLETLANLYGKEKHYSANGTEKAQLLYEGIGHAWNPPEGSAKDKKEYFDRMSKKSLKWVSSSPSQPVAHLTYVLSLREYAWFIRGAGYSNTVKDKNRKVFRQYNQMALDYLIKHKDKLDSDIQWYVLMIKTGRDLSLKFSVISKLVEEAERKFDDPQQVHTSTVFYLLPKWRGDIKSLDNFIQQSASRTKVRTSDENYARLYAYAEYYQFNHNLFHDTYVDWKRMKKGYEEITHKYPTEWNKNKFTYYACLAEDKPTTKLLLAEIGSMPALELWGSKAKETFNTCLEWATKSGPPLNQNKPLIKNKTFNYLIDYLNQDEHQQDSLYALIIFILALLVLNIRMQRGAVTDDSRLIRSFCVGIAVVIIFNLTVYFIEDNYDKFIMIAVIMELFIAMLMGMLVWIGYVMFDNRAQMEDLKSVP